LIVLLPEFAGKIGADELRAHVSSYVQKGLISRFAVPEQIKFVDNLPVTSIGKIDKKLLRETYKDEMASAASAPKVRAPSMA